MMRTFDIIDIITAREYDVDPDAMYSRSKIEQIVYARFLAITLRHDDGASLVELAQRYTMNTNSIRYALRKTVELIRFNKAFRLHFQHAQALYKQGCVPYIKDLLSNGAEVRTRTDNQGVARCGIVTQINDTSFTVESFDNTSIKTIHNIETGRVADYFESSLDIVAINIGV